MRIEFLSSFRLTHRLCLCFCSALWGSAGSFSAVQAAEATPPVSMYDIERESAEPDLNGFEVRTDIQAPEPEADLRLNYTLPPAQARRKAMVERMDKTGMRFHSTAIIDSSPDFIKIPDAIKGFKGFSVAKTPPEVEFAVIPLERRFLPAIKDGYYMGEWTNWGEGNFHPGTHKFYSAIGNHRAYQAELHILEYDPATHQIKLFPEINRTLGRQWNEFGDGKIHGKLNFFDGDNIIFSPYWCQDPEPAPADYATGYNGGKLLSMNIITGALKDWGEPIPRSTWPYHRIDSRRGLFFGVGNFSEFLCYDLNRHQVRWGGYLPEEDGIKWFVRSMLVDDDTGRAYSSNMSRADPETHMIRYDPVTNRFSKLRCTVPPNSETGEIGQLRAYTSFKTKDSFFVCVAMGGEMFKFYPDQEKTESLGLCWPGPHRYTASLAMSPDEKYVYYVPAAHGLAHYEGTPVVQLNVKTGERKVLAFLFPHLYEQYGYLPSGSFSVSLDDKGEKLFITLNGAFEEFKDTKNQAIDSGAYDVLGDPSVCLINIPASERE